MVSTCADWVADRFLAEPHKDPFVFECVDETNPMLFERNWEGGFSIPVFSPGFPPPPR